MRQESKLVADMIVQVAGYSAALLVLSLHETGSQGAYFVPANRQVRCKPLFNFLGAPDLGDVVNRSNQMGTRACIVKDRRNADLPGQPPGREIRRFFPAHDGLSFDRLPVIFQNHWEGRLWNDLVRVPAYHLFLTSVR